MSPGRKRACSQRTVWYQSCPTGPGDVIDGIAIAGAAGFVEAALADNVQALVY